MTDAAEFMSPFQAFLGFDVTDWRDDHAELSLAVRPEFHNRTGVVHGGIVATLLDTAGGIAGCYAPPGQPLRHTRTITMTTNFIAPAQASRIIARGRVVGGGRKIFFSEMTCETPDGTLISTATASYKRVIERD